MTILARRQPINGVRPLRSMLDVFGEDPFFTNFFELKPFEGENAFPVDIAEGDGEMIVRATLPGFDKGDIDVQVQDGMLHINAEHTEESEEKNEKFFRRERRMGSVSRSIALPGGVDESDVNARLVNGVLELRFPQLADVQPKRVTIK